MLTLQRGAIHELEALLDQQGAAMEDILREGASPRRADASSAELERPRETCTARASLASSPSRLVPSLSDSARIRVHCGKCPLERRAPHGLAISGDSPILKRDCSHPSIY